MIVVERGGGKNTVENKISLDEARNLWSRGDIDQETYLEMVKGLARIDLKRAGQKLGLPSGGLEINERASLSERELMMDEERRINQIYAAGKVTHAEYSEMISNIPRSVMQKSQSLDQEKSSSFLSKIFRKNQ